MGYIYKITNKLTNKIYIGQTINLSEREKDYKFFRSQLKRQPKIYNSIKKYGWENFTFEAIEECDNFVLNERERYWQEHYNTVEEGYNCCYTSTTDKKKTFSNESKEKLRLFRTGKKHTKETLDKINKHKCKCVCQYNLEGSFIQEWNSIKEAASTINISESAISACISHKKKHAGGFIWKLNKSINSKAKS